MLRRYIGDRAFYRYVLGIAIPIIIQNGITQFVSLLDNIMVGQIGTIEMSGVSIANQLLLIFNLCVFGANAGAGIFVAQFHGSGDHKGVRDSFRFKLLICLILAGLGICLLFFCGKSLISLYLQGEGDAAEALQTLENGIIYIRIMLLGLIPFALSTAFSGTLRETGQTVVPMIGGIGAVLVNLAFNYLLIFGRFGFPAMGVRGAAIATVISRYVELAVVAGWTALHSDRHPFIKGAFRSLRIPKVLLGSICRNGIPLLLNEFLWSTGMAVISQSYSTCGLDVVPALNISNTIQQLANVASIAIGSSVGIVMGQMLGAGKPEREVRDSNRKLIFLTVACSAVFGGLLICVSEAFPLLYNTTDSVRSLASQMICIIGLMLPVSAFTLSVYFTLRSGGQAFITFLFDSCFLWLGPVMLSFCLSRFTDLSILPLFFVCQAVDFPRAFLGVWMLKKGRWIQNLTT